MMPVSLLIALILAFGFDPARAGDPFADVSVPVLETCGGISLVAILSFGLGLWIASRVSQPGLSTSGLRKRYGIGVRFLTVLSLVVYGWIIHWVGWSRMVRTNWGLDDYILVDDLVVFLPYALIQLVIWWGQFFAERAFQVRSGIGVAGRLGRYLVLRSRQSIGLILPVVLLYVVRRDIISRIWPDWDQSAIAEPAEIAILGSLVLMASPLFVRLAWPTRPLPPGSLRRRLERAAERVGFRFTDVLVWDTGHSMLNACVTGVLPGFRYVLLTDALIESMSPLEVAAVFGHEIGHVAHRHLPYFGFFFAGSLGMLMLFAEGVASCESWISHTPWIAPFSSEILSESIQAMALLIFLGLYFWVVFGHLSRRFERQADVFGSKIVSCNLPECPPHLDMDRNPTPAHERRVEPSICPMGIRIFSDALSNVADWNGIEISRRSWRHGSIASRISFLEKLERNPSEEPRFQRNLRRLRVALGVVLGLAIVLAIVRQVVVSGGFAG
ncbi:MAG: M48 family metallopeptidase [Isosphaeraceae bacterium]